MPFLQDESLYVSIDPVLVSVQSVVPAKNTQPRKRMGT
jgi:hypothetical protein